jgi:hypothetical protein
VRDGSPSVGLGLRGHDGDGALDRSLAERGHDRRTFLRGSLVPASLINDTPDVSPLQTAEVGYRYLRTLRF